MLKIPKFHLISGVVILCKRAVPMKVWEILSKLYTNCKFSQNFYTRKSGESSVFYAVACAIILLKTMMNPNILGLITM